MVAGEERSTIDLVQVWPRSRWVFVVFLYGMTMEGSTLAVLVWDYYGIIDQLHKSRNDWRASDHARVRMERSLNIGTRGGGYGDP